MLTKAALGRCLPLVRPLMGKGGEFLDQLVGLMVDDGSINLGRALRALYPGVNSVRAQANLRQLRLDIKEAADKTGVSLQLSGDGKTRSSIEDRLVWFDGEDRLGAATQQWTQPNIQGPPRFEQDAVKLGPVRLYLVYAQKDGRDAEKLRRELEPYFLEFDFWVTTNHDILPGETIEDIRAEARKACDLTLQLLSPQFQAERLATEKTERAVPVLLHQLVREPKDVEIFRYRGRSFDKSPARDFAHELFAKIQHVLAKSERTFEADLRALARHEAKFVEGLASPVSLEREIDVRPDVTNRCDALTFLRQWLDEEKAPKYCALLGELGMGKTTTAKELARRLWEKRGNGEQAPMAIFLDLRFVGDAAANDPDLGEIVRQILKRDWKGGPGSQPPAQAEIYKLVADGALIIFDGLDEVLVHLTPSQGRLFTQQLFRILPPKADRGRLLITCRTHFFRTFKEQCAYFTMEDREPIRGENYRALVLLPFGEEQIRTYLKNSLPERNVDEVYAFLRSVHNLPELAERPYTLNLIARQFNRLEGLKATGKPVTGLTLYRFVVEEWLLRDGGKHHFSPDHKQMLMEYVAAELLRSGGRSWSAAQLEQWLMDFLESNRGIASHYDGVKRDLLKEDLRTATFLVREENSDQFRFAHSSLQEYFLACYLRRGLEESAFANWALTGVSPETLDFLGQSLQERPSELARRGLAALRDSYRPQASELAFRYVLMALSSGYPTPTAAGFQLPGADLFGLEADYPGPGLLDLGNLNLKGARIANTFWRNFRLAAADFSDADAARAEWHDCNLTESRWDNTELQAAIFRRCALPVAAFDAARTYRTTWLRCAGAGPEHKGPTRVQVHSGHSDFVYDCAWSADDRRVLSTSDDTTLKIWDAASGDCLLTLSGHLGPVSGCAWSADGRRVLSASWDRTLKIWDAASGDCLLTLSGHSAFVADCAWSADSRRVLSASWDHTLKIWDAASGDCLLTLSGHSASVSGCAWSADGRRVLSASGDATLKIWDTASGDCLLTLSDHSNFVYSCAWSSDGRRVLSASRDRTLKICDAASGDCLLTLSGHSGPVFDCAWSADGRRVLSASEDNALKIWDAVSGDCLLTLFNHSDFVSGCAWSADGRRVLSASGNPMKIWDAASGDCLLTLSGHSASVFTCAWSADSRRVLSTSADNTLKIWDAASGDCLLTLSGHSASVSGCAWSADGSRVLSASGDATLKIWDTASGDCLLTLSDHSNFVSGCAWSPDGRRLLSASRDKTLKIWDAASGDCLLTLTGHSVSVSGCAWSPDGHRLLSASLDKTLKIWDAASGDCLLTLTGHSVSVSRCAWSPDGRRLLSVSDDNILKIWDAASGDCLLTLSDHSAKVSGCAWSPDSRRLLSASRGNTLEIWDAASGDYLLTSARLYAVPRACAWSSDGLRVMAGLSDGSVRIFDADTLDETGPRCYHLTPPHSDPTWASIDPVNNRILGYGEGAWRSVGYTIPDEDGMPVWHSVEAFDDPKPPGILPA